MKNSQTDNKPIVQPAAPKAAENKVDASTLYPEQIPEPQGDLADRANIEIDQEIEEKIMRIRQNISTPDNKH